MAGGSVLVAGCLNQGETAEFIVDDIRIEPEPAADVDTVEIIARIGNAGGAEGTQHVTLVIDGETHATDEVTIQGSPEPDLPVEEVRFDIDLGAFDSGTYEILIETDDDADWSEMVIPDG